MSRASGPAGHAVCTARKVYGLAARLGGVFVCRPKAGCVPPAWRHWPVALFPVVTRRNCSGSVPSGLSPAALRRVKAQSAGEGAQGAEPGIEGRQGASGREAQGAGLPAGRSWHLGQRLPHPLPRLYWKRGNLLGSCRAACWEVPSRGPSTDPHAQLCPQPQPGPPRSAPPRWSPGPRKG